jgi:NADP-dependent 3-hydroxy acid dehydrogenase YdfG
MYWQAQLVTAGAPVENVMVARVDVTDRQAVYAATKQIESVLGHVQILINNAGIVTGKKILDCPDDLMEKTVQVNATKVVHALAPHA